MLQAVKKAGRLVAFFVVVMIPINILASLMTSITYPLWQFRLFPFEFTSSVMLTAISFFTGMVFIAIAFPILNYVIMLIGIYFFFLPYSNVILDLMSSGPLQALFVPVVSMFWFPATGAFWLAGIAGTFIGGLMGYTWFSDTLPHRIHRKLTGGVL